MVVRLQKRCRFPYKDHILFFMVESSKFIGEKAHKGVSPVTRELGLQDARGLMWVRELQLQKGLLKTRWTDSEAAAYFLVWGSFSLVVLLQVGEYHPPPALLG